MEPRYVIGIDLGTTNSALAYAEVKPDADPFAPANVQLLAIPQLENPGEVRDEGLLPSFLYLPGPSDFPPGTIALPWDAERGYVVLTYDTQGTPEDILAEDTPAVWVSHKPARPAVGGDAGAMLSKIIERAAALKGGQSSQAGEEGLEGQGDLGGKKGQARRKTSARKPAITRTTRAKKKA